MSLPTNATNEDFYVRENLAGKGAGLFAARSFKRGAQIYRFDYWSQASMPIHFTNHSCDANAAFDADGMLTALRDIEPHQEITFDYLAHPIPASPWNFACGCGAQGCVGWIQATYVSEASEHRDV